MADLAALVHKSTPPPRRVATAGMADLAAPVTKPTSPQRVAAAGMADLAAPVKKSTSPQRVAAAGMADLAAPVKKSTWPTRPVATPGAAHPAAPVPHADQAPTSTAVPALPHSILPMSKRKATLMDQQLADLSQLLGATEAKKRMADIIVDRMAASYSAHCDSNEAFVYR